MYLEQLPEGIKTSHKVKIRYDCCNTEHELTFFVANKNFIKNKGKHVCRKCWLASSDNPAKRPEVKIKTQQTNIEKYGNVCSMNAPDKIQARVAKMDAMREEIEDKKKQTNIRKYGTDHCMKLDSFKEKMKGVFIDKYGVDNPLKIKEVKDKVAQTNVERYGNVCSLHGEKVKQKTIETMKERYGVEKYNQLPEMKDYLRQHCKEWLKESWESGGSNKDKERPKEWNEKQSRTVIKLIQEGKWQGNTKSSVQGHFISKKCPGGVCFVRSSYEFKACQILDSDDNVEFFDTESVRIEYTDIEGNKHNYVPDFIVKYKDREKLLLIEIKPTDQQRWKNNVLKAQAGYEYAQNNNLDFEVWSEEELKIDKEWNKNIRRLREAGIL